MSGTRVSFAARWDEQTLAEIKARAARRDLSVSEYVKRCALGTIDLEPSSVETRLADLDERLARLEGRAIREPAEASTGSRKR